MSGNMWGQDPEQVRALAELMERHADELDTTRQTIDGLVNVLPWFGPNFAEFSSWWEADLAPSLTSAAGSLRSAGEKAVRNAEQQTQTSEDAGFAGASASGSGSGGGGGLWDSLTNAAGNVVDGVTNVAESVVDGVTNVAESVVDGVTNVAENLWDFGGDVVDGVTDTASSVADWTGDRLSDTWDWMSDRGEAIGDDWANVGDAGLQLWDATGGSILDGEWPRTTEVIASGIRLTGAMDGALVTTITGGTVETNIFDDGDPYAGDPEVVGDPTKPNSLDDLTTSVTEAYNADDGTVRVTTVEGPNGPRVIVSVPGTESWNPSTGDNAMDLTGNLVTAGGGESTMTQAVELAMQNANIPPGAEVMLVGHSQGGMTVADLTSDPDFVSEYNVTNAMTFGSPIDSANIDPRVNVLEMQHTTDAVPRLDLGDDRVTVIDDGYNMVDGDPQAGQNHTTVTLPNAAPVYDPMGNHSHQEYSNSIRESNDPALAAYEQQLRDSGFLAADDNSTLPTTAVDIHVGRKD